MRDPEWEGVVDGEVGGLGAIADSVRTFLHWVPIKLETREALRLCVSCGDTLSQEVRWCCAVCVTGCHVLVFTTVHKYAFAAWEVYVLTCMSVQE